MTRQLVKMGDKAMNRNGVATLKLHHAAVSLPTPNVCVVISTSDAVFVCVRVRFDCGGSAQIGCSEEGGKQTKGGEKRRWEGADSIKDTQCLFSHVYSLRYIPSG